MSVALATQHAMCIRRTLLSPVASMVLPYFSTLPHKWDDCRETVTEPKMCVLIFSATFETLLILRRNERDINVRTSSSKVPVILFRC